MQQNFENEKNCEISIILPSFELFVVGFTHIQLLSPPSPPPPLTGLGCAPEKDIWTKYYLRSNQGEIKTARNKASFLCLMETIQTIHSYTGTAVIEQTD